MPLGSEFWEKEREKLFEILFPLIHSNVQSAVQEAFDDLGISGGVSWELVNQAVSRFASEYTFSLVSQINGTTQSFLQASLQEWVFSGADLDALIDTLTPMFGKSRAALVAATETTRVFAEGNVFAWRSTGLVEGLIWNTAEDQLVCPICGPITGAIAHIDILQFKKNNRVVHEGLPPAHPGCRCWVRPKVVKSYVQYYRKLQDRRARAARSQAA